jgi:hypothetical protein
VASLALQAHALLAPAVPLIGWDVALPAEGEPCLLEMNISANNFNGAYDRWVGGGKPRSNGVVLLRWLGLVEGARVLWRACTQAHLAMSQVGPWLIWVAQGCI